MPPSRKPTIGRPKDADAELTRRNIIVAAHRMFGQLGFASATIAVIADAAGVSPAAIYRYFGSKLDLYVAAFLDAQAQILPAFIAEAAKGDTFVDKLRLVNLEAGRTMAQDPTLGDFLLSSAIEIRRYPEIGQQIAAGSETALSQFNAFMRTTFDLDSIPLDFPPEHLGMMFTGCMFGIGIMSLLYNDASMNDLLEPYIALVRQGLSTAGTG